MVRFYEEIDYDFQIVRDYIEDLNNVSGRMMYQKGAWTLHMLRETIGVEAYEAAIRSYYAEFMGPTVSKHGAGRLRRSPALSTVSISSPRRPTRRCWWWRARRPPTRPVSASLISLW